MPAQYSKMGRSSQVLVQNGKRVGVLVQYHNDMALVLFGDGPWFVPASQLKLYRGHDILLEKCYGKSPWTSRKELAVKAGKLAVKTVKERRWGA